MTVVGGATPRPVREIAVGGTAPLDALGLQEETARPLAPENIEGARAKPKRLVKLNVPTEVDVGSRIREQWPTEAPRPAASPRPHSELAPNPPGNGYRLSNPVLRSPGPILTSAVAEDIRIRVRRVSAQLPLGTSMS